MFVVLGATLCTLINVIQTTTTTTTTTSNVTTSSNMTELERSMRETDTILEALERAIDEAKVVFKDKNITMDVRHIDSNKDDYRNFLSQLLANTTVRSDGNTDRGEGEAENMLTPARRQKSNKLKLFEFVSLSKKKNRKKDKEREMNRIIMQGKIDEWLLNRELEKKKIKNYINRVRVARLEKCYRQGVSKKKKRKKTRRRNDDDDKKKTSGEDSKKTSEDESEKKKKKEEKRKKRQKEKYTGGRLYPCCRKCCKKSYMGCL